jgi:hypothetical protein
MATTDTLCFGNHDPVTGAPVINGLVDYDYLPFDAADPFESGYVGGSKLTFEGGGLARVIFQGVRVPAGDKIVMGFMARFDSHFDTDDMIILALRSTFGGGAERLVAIFPNLDAVGAEPGVGSGPYQIKRNVIPPATRIDYWSRASSATPWSPMASDPVGVEVKLRSWKPNRPAGSPDEVAWSVEVSWPRVGADGFTLNDDFGLYFNVVRVLPLAAALAVEAPFPTTAPTPSDSPGPSFIVPQWGHGLIPAIQVPAGSNTGVGVRFKNGSLGVGRRAAGSASTTLTGTIEGPTGPADNEIVAIVENTANVAANDIWAEFRFANWGLPAADFPAWDLAAGAAPNPAPRRVGVPPFDPAANLAAAASPATPTSTELVSTWPRADVPVEYQAHDHQCIWVQLDSATGVNFTESSVRRNMDFAHFSDLEREAEVSGSGYPEPEDGSGEHDFVLQTFCRKIIVTEIIAGGQADADTEALVGGALQQGDQEPEPDMTVHRSAASTGSQFKDTVVFIWMTQGYRRSGKFMKIRGTNYEVLDHRPGEFGIVARHEGLADPFHFALSGPGMVRYAPGIYGLKVPHKGKVTIGVKLGASPGGPEGDQSELPDAKWPKGREPGGDRKGCLAVLLALIFGAFAGMLGKKS